jgi:pimeloyl-ACP methyl ester carboxylesterase
MATAATTPPRKSTIKVHQDPTQIAADDSILHTRPIRSRFFQWVPTDDDQVRLVEQRILAGLVYTQRFVAGINTISSPSWNVTHKNGGKTHTVVLVHGFAGGLGCWAQNWKHLTEEYNVHAIDLPGFGRSMRDGRSFNGAHDAMKYYYDALHAWFGDAGIPPNQSITVVGHSFGGYVLSHYTMELLWRKKKLEDALGAPVTDHDLLASPPEKVTPSSTCKSSNAVPAGNHTPLGGSNNNITIVFPPPNIVHLVLADPWGVPPKYKRVLPFKFRMLIKLFYKVSPLAILRCAGPWGPNLLPKVRPDFAERWDHLPDPLIFYDYTYHSNAQTPATGELAFQACCEGAAFAKVPLLLYIPEMLRCIATGVDTTHNVRAASQELKLKKESNEPESCKPPSPATMAKPNSHNNRTPEESCKKTAIPHLTLLHGDHTWMDTAMYQRLVDTLLEDGNVGSVTIGSIVSAGHQLNTDNADDFNRKLNDAIRRGARSPSK